MTAPLAGIRVLEVANWLAAPAAAALLADLGADVIKVEPPGGDVYREFLLRSMGYTHEFAEEPAGFDYAAFWGRSGLMGLLGEPPSPPPLCRGGQGDHTTALNLLAATLVALRLRDRTNEAQHVEVTLQGTGMWTLAGDLQPALVSREQPARHVRSEPANPIWNSYQTGSGRWILLVMPTPDPLYWPRFCEMIGRPEWARDPRYATLHDRRRHSRELTREIELCFASQDYAHWAKRLDEHGLIWAPVATLPDVIDVPQAREMGWFTTLEHPTLGRFETLDTPFKLYGADVRARGPAPEAGAHTFDVLAELGVGDEELAKLAADGVI